MEAKQVTVEEGKTWRDIFQKYKHDITDDEIDYILWNHTCYPFSDEVTLTQIEQYFNSTSNQTI